MLTRAPVSSGNRRRVNRKSNRLELVPTRSRATKAIAGMADTVRAVVRQMPSANFLGVRTRCMGVRKRHRGCE
jgi:hypothetical protein